MSDFQELHASMHANDTFEKLGSEDNNHRWLALYYPLHLHLHLHLAFLFITDTHGAQLIFLESGLLYNVVSLFMGIIYILPRKRITC